MFPVYISAIESSDDRDKVEQLYTKYEKVMFLTAMKYLKDNMLAEDAVHNA